MGRRRTAVGVGTAVGSVMTPAVLASALAATPTLSPISAKAAKTAATAGAAGVRWRYDTTGLATATSPPRPTSTTAPTSSRSGPSTKESALVSCSTDTASSRAAVAMAVPSRRPTSQPNDTTSGTAIASRPTTAANRPGLIASPTR